MYNVNSVAIIKSLRNQVDVKGLRHVQMLVGSCRTDDGERHLCVKFLYLDNDNYKKKVKAITDRYCESLTLRKETKTTVTYML